MRRGNNLRKFLFTGFFFFWFCNLWSQTLIGRYKLPAIIIGEDTIPIVTLPVVNIIDFADSNALKKLQAYYRLRYNVIKVYPYARLTAIKIHELNRSLDRLSSKREKRRYVKEYEKQLKNDFEEQLKKLSVNQGKILVKLIDRETGMSSYELIKEARGSVNAFFWQQLAWVYGNNLKVKYDPSQGEDRVIESIVQLIETGQINQN